MLSGHFLTATRVRSSHRSSFWDSRSVSVSTALLFSPFFHPSTLRLHVYAYLVVSGFAITEGRKSGDRAPGEFGFNPLNLGKSPAIQKDYALKEVRNGRLAMFAMAGILLQEVSTGKGAIEGLF